MSPSSVSIIARMTDATPAAMEALYGLVSTLTSAGLRHDVTLVAPDAQRALEAYRAVAPFKSAVRAVPAALDGDLLASLRRAVLDASGEVIAVLDEPFGFRPREFEYGVAMLQAGSSDILIGVVDDARSLIERSQLPRTSYALRRLLAATFTPVPATPFSGLRLFVDTAAKLVFAEAKGGAPSLDLELLWLARKYGFRIDEFPNAMVGTSDLPPSSVTWERLRDVARMRRLEAQQLYRQPRRCPICFSSNVRTYDQTNGHVIRSCRRCKCRYLAELPSLDEQIRTRNLRIRSEVEAEELAQRPGKLKTFHKRAQEIRRIITPGARVLEIGARRGELGELLQRDYDYVGIEISDQAARAARAKNLSVYCATIERFVNDGPTFDAVILSDVFEHLTNPHDVLGAIREQLKVGGSLLLFTPDTESLTSAFTAKRWSAYKVPEHVILYSRSALIEMLEHSGFEIVTATAAYEYFDHRRILKRGREWPSFVQTLLSAALRLAPDPLLASAGSIRIVARRRFGSNTNVRAIPSVEATHAR